MQICMKCRLYSHLYHTFIYVISPGFSSAVLFLCNYWLLSIFPLSVFGAARGLPDCQHKLKSWVLAASTEWRELVQALIFQARDRLRDNVSEYISFKDQDLSSKRSSTKSPSPLKPQLMGSYMIKKTAPSPVTVPDILLKLVWPLYLASIS